MGEAFQFLEKDDFKDLPWSKPIKGSKLSTKRFKNQNFMELRKNCLKIPNRLFKDPEFPIDGEDKRWKRPTEIVQNPCFIENGVSRFDVNQGSVCDCWFLSTLGCLTLHPELVNRVIPSNQNFQENYAGIFHFYFWYYGEWIDVVIDDRLLCTENTDGTFCLKYGCSSSEQNEFWSPLLEKAFAKLYGSYSQIAGGYPDEAMEILTGGVVERYLNNYTCRGAGTTINTIPPKFFEILRESINSPTIITCGILCNRVTDFNNMEITVQDVRLYEQHAYSIIDLITKNNTNFLRIRNPYGSRKPNWDKSYGTNQPHETLGDGEFWMSYDDFLIYFGIVEICHYGPGVTMAQKWSWKEIDLKGEWKGSTAAGCGKNFRKNPYHVFKFRTEKPKQKETLIVALMQKNIKGNRKFCFKIGFDLYSFDVKSNRSRDRIEPNQPDHHFLGFREECDQFNIESGIYSIHVCTECAGQEAEYFLRIITKSNSFVDILGTEPWFKIKKNKQRRKLFKENCFNGEIDWERLKNILTLKKIRIIKWIPKFERKYFDIEFSDSVIRTLLNAYDKNHSGTLNEEEFICLFCDLQKWKDIFKKYRKQNSDKFILTPDELQKALDSIKISIPENDFIKKPEINFGDSLIFALQLDAKDN